MTTTTYPVTVPAEVTAFVADLGLESVFRGLLDGIPEVFPDVLSVTCEVDPGVQDEVEEMDPSVLIWAFIPDTGAIDPTPHQKWVPWELARYSGKDLMHFNVHFVHPATP